MPSEQGWVKTNIVANLIEDGFWGLGEITCNTEGKTLSFNSSRIQGNNDSAPTKATAMKWAMENMVKTGIKDDIPKNRIKVICKSMWKMKILLKAVKFKHTLKENNQEAHYLTRVCVTNNNNSKKHVNVVGLRSIYKIKIKCRFFF